MVVNKMIRPKKKFVCSSCGHEIPKWEGFCRNCKAVNTYVEKVLIEPKVKPKGTLAQKGIRRRAIKSERESARSMQEADGPDPFYRNITSSTGRVGHITGMQIDAITLNWVIENKNRTMPLWLLKAWIQIVQRGQDFGKHPLLHIEPSNMPKEYVLNGVKYKTPNMAVIPQKLLEEFIRMEKAYAEVQNVVESTDSNVVRIRKIQKLLGL